MVRSSRALQATLFSSAERGVLHGADRVDAAGVQISRAAEEYFDSVVWSTNVFDYGVVNRGPIVINGGALVGGGGVAADGSILSMAQVSSPVSITRQPTDRPCQTLPHGAPAPGPARSSGVHQLIAVGQLTQQR
jgi:hypothetical protein